MAGLMADRGPGSVMGECPLLEGGPSRLGFDSSAALRISSLVVVKG